MSAIELEEGDTGEHKLLRRLMGQVKVMFRRERVNPGGTWWM